MYAYTYVCVRVHVCVDMYIYACGYICVYIYMLYVNSTCYAPHCWVLQARRRRYRRTPIGRRCPRAACQRRGTP